MQAKKLIGAAVVVASLGGLAIAGDREAIPEKVRALAAKIFQGQDPKISRVAVYEVKGKDASGRELALLVTEDGAPFRQIMAATPAPTTGARPFLGIRFTSADEATVAGTFPGTAAEKAGLKQGDRIVQVGDRAIGSATELAEALGACQPGQKVKLVIERDGWKKTIDVTLGVRPAKLDEDDDEDEDHDERSEHNEKSMKKPDERGEKDDD
jgi:predicted metalloprotease with PDZ domain